MGVNVRAEGKIILWNDEKGYGFASTNTRGVEVFLQIKEFQKSDFRPVVDQQVSFIITEEQRGKPYGKSVFLCGEKLLFKPKMFKKSSLILPLLSVISLILVLCYGIQSHKLVWQVAAIYAVFSVFSFYQYAKDKAAARERSWRIREVSLQFWALCGGWPGAFLAQSIFCHKRRKPLFMLVFYLIITLHIAIISWIFTAQANVLLRSEIINLQFWLEGSGYVDVLQVWWWKLSYFLNNTKQ
jgi:uncharacterized membrane protein YsdA (DUF1294 family)/cold shock CspA family protein